MDAGETRDDTEQDALEENAVVRGWLKLADDVLKTAQPEEKAESDPPA